MKLRAMFCTLLIVMIGFAGFGFTTSDLGQNSTAAVSAIEVENAVIVVKADVTEIQETFVFNEITIQFESESLSFNVFEFHYSGTLENSNFSTPGGIDFNNYLIRQYLVDKQIANVETHKNDLGGVLTIFYNYGEYNPYNSNV